MGETKGWMQCPAGELDRLETRLKALQFWEVWGKSTAAVVLGGIIVVSTWTIAAAVWPALPFNAPASEEIRQPPKNLRQIPRPGPEGDEGPNFPEQNEQRNSENQRPDPEQDPDPQP